MILQCTSKEHEVPKVPMDMILGKASASKTLMYCLRLSCFYRSVRSVETHLARDVCCTGSQCGPYGQCFDRYGSGHPEQKIILIFEVHASTVHAQEQECSIGSMSLRCLHDPPRGEGHTCLHDPPKGVVTHGFAEELFDS